MRTGLVFAHLLLSLVAGCDRATPAADAVPSGAVAVAVADTALAPALPLPPPPPPAPPGCAPLDAGKVARFSCADSPIAAAIPPLVDPHSTLAPFYERVAELARGGARPVRIAMYGDSNLTADAASGRLRRELQARFGDGGHGYVALAQPWPWYSHNDVHHDGTWKLTAFRQIATSNRRVADNYYGFANIASECAVPGCAAWVSTDPQPGAPIGWTASRFDLYYLKRPDGGQLDIALDGEVVRSVDTRSPSYEAGFEHFDTTDSHHELKVLVRGHGPVRLFGVVLERALASIQVDSLGCGSLNLEQMAMVNEDLRRAQLQRRAYDLVIIQLGTNVFGTETENKKNAKLVVDQLRAALPALSILFLSPPDASEEDETRSDPRIVQLQKTMRAVAEENEAAFWDYRAAMGGDRSMLALVKKGLGERDHVHLKKIGHEVMADRFLCALWDGVSAHVEAHATAGCAPSSATSAPSAGGSASATSASKTLAK